MKKIPKIRKKLPLIIISVIIFLPVGAFAQSSSTNYQLEEAYFGTGGELDSSSTNFRARSQAGSLGVGNSSSANFDLSAGGVTQNTEFLEMAVTGADVNFGTLSDSAASFASSQGGACSCSFYVRTYISSDYSVVSVSQPPTSENGDTIDAKNTQGVPSTDTSVEEFGFNLVANTSPGAFGASPVNQPDDTFADGEAATGYETANQFKYTVGDEIARSPASVGNPAIGLTEFTISYILKPAINTEAGTYEMEHVLVVVPTF